MMRHPDVMRHAEVAPPLAPAQPAPSPTLGFPRRVGVVPVADRTALFVGWRARVRL